MSIPATQMRPGMIIKHKDDLHLVFAWSTGRRATCARSSRPS